MRKNDRRLKAANPEIREIIEQLIDAIDKADAYIKLLEYATDGYYGAVDSEQSEQWELSREILVKNNIVEELNE